MTPQIATTPAVLANFISAQSSALIHTLTAKLNEFQPATPILADGSRIVAVKPRILAALFGLANKMMSQSDPTPDAKLFQGYITAARNELKLLQQDWRGPFTFEGVIQQGVGLYLRDAPNLGELVRSKPDFVFAEEVTKVHESDDWLALFILKAKIQILESLRVLTRDPAHVPLAALIHDSLVEAPTSLSQMRPDLTASPVE
jgi:hypothetical protein